MVKNVVKIESNHLVFAGNEFNLSGIEGTVLLNESLAKHTTWKVGGPAKIYYQPKTINDLQKFLKLLENSLPIIWLGLGSNVLVRDAGINGVVINALGKLNQIKVLEVDSELAAVSVEAGATCSKFSRNMAEFGLFGAEFLSGIPGTIGGAMAMNAGAFGGECWDSLEAVKTIDNHGKIRKRESEQYAISYRKVKLKEAFRQTGVASEWFLKGYFSYSKNSQKVQSAKLRIRELLKIRNQTQPVQFANAGSVFKNPPGDFAARLIQECGLKNQNIGDAFVSEKHANFIINRGQATAKDIEALIALVQSEVQDKFGVQLEREVKIIGEKTV